MFKKSEYNLNMECYTFVFVFSSTKCSLINHRIQCIYFWFLQKFRHKAEARTEYSIGSEASGQIRAANLITLFYNVSKIFGRTEFRSLFLVTTQNLSFYRDHFYLVQKMKGITSSIYFFSIPVRMMCAIRLKIVKEIREGHVLYFQNG